MHVFRDLHVSGDPNRFPEFLESIEGSLRHGWTRDRSAEERGKDRSVRNGHRYCFSCARSSDRRAALLALSEQTSGVLYVSNIVPTEGSRLSRGEYNRILEEFHELFVRPSADRSGLKVELTSANVDIENWVSPATARVLRAFSECANKATGSSHQSDRKRWFEFLLAAHRESAKLDSGSLQQWLTEVEDWPTDVADELISEYEFGRELLVYADRH